MKIGRQITTMGSDKVGEKKPRQPGPKSSAQICYMTFLIYLLYVFLVSKTAMIRATNVRSFSTRVNIVFSRLIHADAKYCSVTRKTLGKFVFS